MHLPPTACEHRHDSISRLAEKVARSAARQDTAANHGVVPESDRAEGYCSGGMSTAYLACTSR